MALMGGLLETGGGDGVAAVAAAGASLLEREPAAIAHGGGALKKHSLLKVEDALAALRHGMRPPPAARAALLLLLGRIRCEALPAFAPPGVLRACSCVVCCVLFALERTTRSGFVRSQAKSRGMNLPLTQGQSRPPNLSEDSVAPDPGRPRVVAPGSTRTAGRPWVDPRSVVRSANERAALQSTELMGRL